MSSSGDGEGCDGCSAPAKHHQVGAGWRLSTGAVAVSAPTITADNLGSHRPLCSSTGQLAEIYPKPSARLQTSLPPGLSRLGSSLRRSRIR